MVGPSAVPAKTSGRTPLYRQRPGRTSNPATAQTCGLKCEPVCNRNVRHQVEPFCDGNGRDQVEPCCGVAMRHQFEPCCGGVWAEGRGPQGGVRAWRLWVSAAELAVAPEPARNRWLTDYFDWARAGPVGNLIVRLLAPRGESRSH